MEAAPNGFVQLAVDLAWQVTAISAFVLLVTRMVARSRPHLAHMLWLVVLLKCITPPIWSSPSSVFSWLRSSPPLRVSPERTVEMPAAPPVFGSAVWTDANSSSEGVSETAFQRLVGLVPLPVGDESRQAARFPSFWLCFG